jgi:spore maturation protein CgeB
MRILLAGNFRFAWWEEACSIALEDLGHEVIRFPWYEYFESGLGKAEKYAALVGPITRRINQKLIQAVTENKADLLLVWTGVHVTAKTLERIRQLNPQCIIAAYNNDDPFSPKYTSAEAPFNQKRLWKIFRSAIASYDMHFVFRPINVSEVLKVGAKEAHVLMPYYIPELHQPACSTEDQRHDLECDIAFIGHYEPDGREQYIRALVEAGIHTKLYGEKYWTQSVLGDLAEYFGEVHPVYGVDYRNALSGAKIGLCFLSKLNRDTYTCRCFEIPACGTLLLSERTDDLTRMFVEDEEAVFFSSQDELIEKVLWLKSHPEKIEQIAQAGMKRVRADGHSIDERMKKFMNQVGQFKNKSIGVSAQIISSREANSVKINP